MTISSFIDLTRELSEDTPVYPGDPKFRRELLRVAEQDDHSSFNLFEIHMGNHTGTHIDFPAHILAHGKTSSDYSINDLTGEGCLLEFPNIDYSFIKKNDIVFFKSMTSPAYLTASMAKKLIGLGVKIVGTDQMSIDMPDADALPVHRLLLTNGILIVEGLDLSGINPCRGEIIIAPLNITEIDGVPARVMMRR